MPLTAYQELVIDETCNSIEKGYLREINKLISLIESGAMREEVLEELKGIQYMYEYYLDPNCPFSHRDIIKNIFR